MNKQQGALENAYKAIHSMLETGEWHKPYNVLAKIEEALAEPDLVNEIANFVNDLVEMRIPASEYPERIKQHFNPKDCS